MILVIDYGMGNLFSIQNACENIGLNVCITNKRKEITSADAVILPGVGAFGKAMESLTKLDLVEFLKEVALSDKPFIGICLGMQLLMSESHEFGYHKGLNIIKGEVKKLSNTIDEAGNRLKVPQVGWNRIYKKDKIDEKNYWEKSFLNGLGDGEYMYFVHSFYTVPKDTSVIRTISYYGNIEFCSSLEYKNIFACQFHPERSCQHGIKIYKNLLYLIETKIRRIACKKKHK